MNYYIQYPLGEEERNVKKLNDNNIFFDEIWDIINKFGVVVIDGVFTNNQCDRRAKRIVDGFIKINPNIDVSNSELPKNWNASNIPPETRMGLFQHSSAYFPGVLDVRTNKRIRQIFTEIYSRSLRRQRPDYKKDNLIYTPDGINVLPPHRIKRIRDDWAHVDQPYVDKDLCYQSTISLSDSSAGFRCTPMSHLIHKWICDKYKQDNEKKDLNKWIKFDQNDYEMIRNYLCDVIPEFNPSMWQVCIPSTRGRLIIWNSALIHSAYPNQISLSELKQRFPEQPYLGWRISVYVCYRPLEDFSDTQYQRLIKHMMNRRGTNHWGIKVFAKKNRFTPNGGYSEYIQKLIDDPKSVLDAIKSK